MAREAIASAASSSKPSTTIHLNYYAENTEPSTSFLSKGAHYEHQQ